MYSTLGLLQAAALGFSAIVLVIIAIFVAGLLISSIKVVKEYERGVIFRLGRVRGGPKGPGLFILLPSIDRMVKVDLRIVTLDVPPQDVITRDNVPARVNAVVYFRVIDPNKSVLEIENHVLATSQISQTTLRSVIGQKDLDNLLINREEINEELQRIIDEQTDPWGVKVSVVEVKDVEIPSQMQRAMARQAESERERRAKIIAAEGEYQASQRLRQAADRLESPQALQLRLFQTMGEIAVNQNSTIILPVPIDLLRPYLSGPDGSSDGSRGDYEARAQRERVEEEQEAERLYEEAVGDVPTETPLEAAEERRRVGLATIADVLQARTAASQAQLDLQTTEGSVQTARGALALALGLPANLPYDVDSAAAARPVGELADSVDGLIASALRARPDLAAARSQAFAARAEIGDARSALLPSLNLTATGARTYATTIPNGANSYNLSLGLAIPLFNGFSRQYDLRAAEFQAEAAAARSETIRQQVVYQVFSAYYALQTATRRVRTAEDLIASAQQSSEVARARYKEGVGTVLDLLAAQSALASARAQQVDARLAWSVSLAQLAHDAGVLDPQGGHSLRLTSDTTT